MLFMAWRGDVMAKDAPRPSPMGGIGSSREDVRAFPEQMRLRVGGAPWAAKLKVVGVHDGDTDRAVSTARFAGVVEVLHALRKKSKSGITTPRREIALIDQRLKRAREDHAQWLAGITTTTR